MLPTNVSPSLEDKYTLYRSAANTLGILKVKRDMLTTSSSKSMLSNPRLLTSDLISLPRSERKITLVPGKITFAEADTVAIAPPSTSLV